MCKCPYCEAAVPYERTADLESQYDAKMLRNNQMENVQVKVIGVLTEREDAVNVEKKFEANINPSSNRLTQNDNRTQMEGGASRSLARPMTSKISALDLAGILNSRRRLEWTKEWLRKNQTEFLSKENLSELKYRNNARYLLNNFLDIKENQFLYLVVKLKHEISQFEPQRKKKSFSAEERLAITLKYLATGEVHSCRNYCFRASKPVILGMIANICLSIYTQLKDQFLQLPKNEEQWQNLEQEMQCKHGLTHCVGHIFMREIKFRKSTGTTNEQAQAPLVIGGIIDSSNNFVYVNIETAAAQQPCMIYEKSELKKVIEQKILTLNNLETHSETDVDAEKRNYYFIGDSSLPTKPYLVNPQSVKQYTNCTKTLEQINAHADNTLRILCNMFPILAQPLRESASHNRSIVLACITLYNFLRKTDATFHRRTDNIVKNPYKPNNYFAQYDGDSDDDCIMFATEEELRERVEFTPRVGVTTCFQNLSAQLETATDECDQLKLQT